MKNPYKTTDRAKAYEEGYKAGHRSGYSAGRDARNTKQREEMLNFILSFDSDRVFRCHCPFTVTTDELERIIGWLRLQLFVSDEPKPASPEDDEFTEERSHEVETGNSQTRPPAGRTETPDHPAPGGADADRDLCPPAGANPASSPNLALSPELEAGEDQSQTKGHDDN